MRKDEGDSGAEGAQFLQLFERLPIAAVLIALVIMGVELAIQAAEAGLILRSAGHGLRGMLIEKLAMTGSAWDIYWQGIRRSVEIWGRSLAYGAVHAGFMHALFSVVFVLALGKFLSSVFSNLMILALFMGGLLAGATAFGLGSEGRAILIGAEPGSYALIGAFAMILALIDRREGGTGLKGALVLGFFLILPLVSFAFSGQLGVMLGAVAGMGFGVALSVLRIFAPQLLRKIRARSTD